MSQESLGISASYAISVAPFDLTAESESALQQHFSESVRFAKMIAGGVNLISVNPKDLEVLYEASGRASSEFPSQLGRLLTASANILNKAAPIVPVVLVSGLDRPVIDHGSAMKLLAPAA